MPRILVITYVAAVLALIAAAIGIGRLRCEGFGCIGTGIAWFAWVATYFVVLGGGLLARSKAASSAGLAQATRIAWSLQLAAGMLAVSVWLMQNAT